MKSCWTRQIQAVNLHQRVPVPQFLYRSPSNRFSNLIPQRTDLIRSTRSTTNSDYHTCGHRPFKTSLMSSTTIPMSVSSTSISSHSSNSVGADTVSGGRKIEELQFDNLVLRTLPVDKEKRNFTREVPDACFSLVMPTPVLNPRLVCYSPDVLRWIELAESETQRPDFAEFFSGNKLIPGARPAAHTYCGHQFGHFSGQLGDGATMYLGEIVTSKGERIEIQFKGAGPTPYSRRADGRKVLRSSIREFLCSEANHYLGIPTTRAGTIVTSDTRVERDIYYDGNSIQERATIITRLAPSFLRFGSFEIAKGVDSITGRAGPSPGRHDLIKQILDYVVSTFYADIIAPFETEEEKYLAFFRELTRRTAMMVAKWQAVGWCHGVLNTDNMSILGLTIDYGPFGYMENFDPEYICNGSDSEGRYRYEAQPEICGWNLLKLSQNFEPFISKEKMREIVGEYEGMYEAAMLELNKKKFGLDVFNTNQMKPISTEESKEEHAATSTSPQQSAQYDELITSFYSTLALTGGDFTNSFRCLSQFQPDDELSVNRTLDHLVSQCATLASKIAALAPRIPPQQMLMIQHLLQTNPQLFEQPGMEEQFAIIQQEMARKKERAELGQKSQSAKEAEDRANWKVWLDSYATILRHELTTAQGDGHTRDEWLEVRRRVQNSVNPKYILRNWIAQEVIAAAEKGDYRPVRECLERLRDPYDIDDSGEVQQAGEAEAKELDVSAMAKLSSHVRPDLPTQSVENQQDMKCHQPPPETKCALHWNKKRPDWANNLKVT